MHRNSFNALRLFAAAQVVFMHSYAHLSLQPTFGGTWLFDFLASFPGVPVFFAISGYLIAQSFDRSRSTFSFFGKRVRRIYPGLIFNILVLEILVTAAGQNQYWPLSSWFARLKYELLYGITASSYFGAIWSGVKYAAPTGDFWPRYPSGVLWTLTVELSFYFFIPLVLLATRRVWLRVALVTSLAAGSLLLSGTYMANTANAKSPIFRHMDILVLPYFWIFAVGVLFAILRVPERLKHKTAFIFGLGALMVTMAFWREDSWILWKSGAEWTSVVQTLALGAFIVLLGSTRIFYFGGRLDNHDLSYGLYLWHMLVVTLLMKSALVGNPWALLPAYAGAFALAWLSWATVEQRFLLRREPRSFEAAPAE